MDFDQKRQELRSILGPLLPDKLNTDFNLNRWIKNYEGVRFFPAFFYFYAPLYKMKKFFAASKHFLEPPSMRGKIPRISQ